MSDQDSLFPSHELQPRQRRGGVDPAAPSFTAQALARQIPAQVRLGTSSWHFPGWRGVVWDREYSESALSRHGLPAYAAQPLLRTVSLDRAFYRPLTASQYSALADQVPADFRFLVKAPSLVTDAQVRGPDGRGREPNPAFLDPALALSEFVLPAFEGLGAKLGALVFQISPLPAALAARPTDVIALLERLLAALPAPGQRPSGVVVAVEVRDAALIRRELADALRAHGATYCLGLHPKLPPIDEQLPILRALWPGPLVCRWNLNRLHGAYGYEDAKGLYEPFDRLVDEDPATRGTLAHIARATAAAGHAVYVTINNKAEGSAPLSVQALAAEIAAGAISAPAAAQDAKALPAGASCPPP